MLLKKEQSTDVCQYVPIDMYMYKIHQVLEKTLLLNTLVYMSAQNGSLSGQN